LPFVPASKDSSAKEGGSVKRDRPARDALLAKLALALGSTLIWLALVEGILRLCHWPAEDPVWAPCRETAFKFAPNIRYRQMSAEYDVEFGTNRLGLRSDEVGPKRGFRVLLLGDSFTCGYGVERAQTFADLLRKRLGVEVINAGVGGFEIIHQVQYYHARGRQLRPDLVVLATYLGNDLTNNVLWQSTPDGGLRRCDGRRPLVEKGTPKLICLLKRLVPLRRLYHILCRPLEHGGVSRPETAYLGLCAVPPDDAARRNYAVSERLLRQLRDEVAAGGARLVVLSIPPRAAVEDASPRAYAGAAPGAPACDLWRPARELDAICRRWDIPHATATDGLRAEWQRAKLPLYFPRDGHLNAEGHRCVARIAYPILAAGISAQCSRHTPCAALNGTRHAPTTNSYAAHEVRQAR
jgi:lysophospholipase L1-like esterase